MYQIVNTYVAQFYSEFMIMNYHHDLIIYNATMVYINLLFIYWIIIDIKIAAEWIAANSKARRQFERRLEKYGSH